MAKLGVYGHGMKRLIIGSALLLISQIGCGKVPQVHYYTIEFVPQDASHTDPVHPISVGVAKFDGGYLYDTDRIVFRDSTLEIRYWNYRRWIASPAILATDGLQSYLKKSALFRDVTKFPSVERPRYIFLGKINAFEEYDTPTGWYGRVEYEIKLKDIVADRVIWQKTYAEQQRVEQKNPSFVVQGIGVALNRCLQRTTDDLKNDLGSLLSPH